MRRRWIAGAGVLVLLGAVALILRGDRPAASGPGSAPSDEALTVAAASDLQFVFTELGRRFEAQTGRRVVISFGSTGNLARQIESGAPFDLFAAADVRIIDRLDQRGLILPGTAREYAIGRIALASSPASRVPVRELSDLLDSGIRKVVIANPEHAPYGQAAREAMQKAEVWERLQPKLVLAENIRQALQLLQTGNADAGILALSLAGEAEIPYRVLDSRLHAPIRQALAVVRRTRDEETARRFAAFVTGPEGRELLKQHGFGLPEQ